MSTLLGFDICEAAHWLIKKAITFWVDAEKKINNKAARKINIKYSFRTQISGGNDIFELLTVTPLD